MTTVNATGNTATTTATTAVATAATANSAISEGQDRFLKLLVTQLKNQDPLNPMDNAQITSQMAQISTVSGIDKLNSTLKDLVASFAVNQSMQATAMIGHSVFAPGSSIELKDGKAVGAIDLAQAADKVVVLIRDGGGQVLHKVDLGPQAAGVVGFEWDGIVDSGAGAAAGKYSFAVEAGQGGKKIDASGLALGVVTSVKQGAGGTVLDVNGLGTVALSAIKQVM